MGDGGGVDGHQALGRRRPFENLQKWSGARAQASASSRSALVPALTSAATRARSSRVAMARRPAVTAHVAPAVARISSSLPSSRETPSEPFRAPELAAGGPGLGEALTGALGDQVALDLGEQREQRGHDLGLDVTLALDADVLLQRHEGDAGLGERVEDGDDLTQRPAEPGEFADDQAVAALEAVQQLVEPASLVGSLLRRRSPR